MDTPSKYIPKPKDKPITEISTKVKGCYLEHKFKEGDPARACPFGRETIDLDACQNCRWLFDVNGQTKSRGYDEAQDIMAIATVMKGIREKKK